MKKETSQQLRSRVVDYGKNPLLEGDVRSLRTRVVVAERRFPCSNQLVGNPLETRVRRETRIQKSKTEKQDVHGSMTELSRNGGFG